MPFRIRVGIGLVLLSLAVAGHAVRVQRLPLSEIRDQSSAIVVAEVIFEETRLGPDAKMVWTDYELRIEEVLLGADLPARKTLSFAGGQSGGHEVGITGVPRLELGKRYVLFLLADGTPWATPTVGWGQGIFEIVPARSDREPEVLVSYDGEPLEIGARGLRRGDFVLRKDQWIELPAAPNRRQLTREPEPVVLNADGKAIAQPPRAPELRALPLDQRSFATLDHLRSFVAAKIEEDNSVQ